MTVWKPLNYAPCQQKFSWCPPWLAIHVDVQRDSVTCTQVATFSESKRYTRETLIFFCDSGWHPPGVWAVNKKMTSTLVSVWNNNCRKHVFGRQWPVAWLVASCLHEYWNSGFSLTYPALSFRCCKCEWHWTWGSLCRNWATDNCVSVRQVRRLSEFKWTSKQYLKTSYKETDYTMGCLPSTY